MDGKMNPKKFLLYYVPVAIVVLILGRIFPQWVEEHIVIYYVVLLGWAGVADMLASRPSKDNKMTIEKPEPIKKNNKKNNNRYYSKNTKKKHK